MELSEAIEAVGKGIDVLGVAVMVAGLAGSLLIFVRDAVGGGDRAVAYGTARRNVGRSILFGLELLVAGDIIRTVAVAPTFASVGVLAVIVLIRTFLSTTLEMEISGRWPWQSRPAVAAAPAAAAASAAEAGGSTAAAP